MNRTAPQGVLITGATGSIGSALAVQYATPGQTLILFGRNQERLAALADHCRTRGARVVTCIVDLRDCRRLMEQLGEVCAAQQPELVIANAGVSSTADSNGESWEAIEEVVQVNLLATMATVQAVLPHLRQRGRAQIALVSSLAAWYGLPITPTYSASKAAIKNYAEALQGSLAGQNVQVSLVLPGFVQSAMSRSVPGPKPFLMPADRAATLIRRGLATGKARISFPFPLALGCWLLAVLPSALSGWLVKRFGHHG